MLVLYLVLCWSFIVSGHFLYEKLKKQEKNYYAPWHCCQLCGSDDFTYMNGRCLQNIEELKNESRLQIEEQSASGLYPISTFDEQCCYFCGDVPGEYIYSKSETGRNGFCAKISETNDGKCSFCKGFVSLFRTVLDEPADYIDEEMDGYCQMTVSFNTFCNTSLKQRLAVIRYYIDQQFSNDQICEDVLSICQTDFINVHEHLVGAAVAPTKIVDPIVDGEAFPSDSIMDLAPLNSSSLFSLIGDGTSADQKLKTFKFLAKYSLIYNTRESSCGDQMSLIKDSSIIDKYRWRSSSCRKERISIRDNSFFSNKTLSVETILKVASYWCHSPVMGIEDVSHQSGIGRNSVADLFQEFRDIAQANFERNLVDRKLGGKGKIVEIGESLMFKARYNRDKNLNRTQVWVFTMIERKTDDVAMFVVPKRDAETLLSLIQQNVQPETLIVSDGLSTYGGIKFLQEYYDNKFANHPVAFVDSNDPRVNTQSPLELMWQKLRTSLKSYYGVPNSSIQTYIYQYIFKRKWKNRCLNVLISEMGSYNE